MTNVDIFKRQDTSPFEALNETDSTMLQELYEKVLLVCENSDFKKLRCNITTQKLKSLLNGKITPKYRSIMKPMSNDVFSTKDIQWFVKSHIKVSELCNEIYFVSMGDNMLQSLIKHIRNAFAHNLIVIESGNIMLGDFYQSNNNPNFDRPTMLAKMTIDNFSLLLTTIDNLRTYQSIRNDE